MYRNFTVSKAFRPRASHVEFERLEREHPYVEQHEEKVPVPPRPADARDGKHDVLFLVLFILFAAVFLIVIVFGGGT